MFVRSFVSSLTIAVMAMGAAACGESGGQAIDSGAPPVDARAVDAAPDATADAAPGAGTWEDPIVIASLPFSYAGDTTAAPADAADAYSPCAPETDESGGEYVFRLTLAEETTIVAYVDDVSGDGVDVDVHLLTAPSPDSCLARDNVRVTEQLSPDTYYVVVDTWRNSAQEELAGPFQLTVEEDSGSGDCLTNPIDCTESDTPLVNGVPSEPAGVGGCPDGMIPVGGLFCIDRYEAMLVEVNSDETLSAWSPYANPGSARVRALSVAGVVPQGYINQQQAAAACAEAGKRLCTDTEWLRACQGAADSTYPYGDALEPGVCNDARTCHPAVQYFETTADWIWSELGNPCINQLPDGLAATGEYSGCESADGAFDMMGNLHEWTADPTGTFRGGFYVDTVINGPDCLYRTTAHGVTHWDYSTGFRCCAGL